MKKPKSYTVDELLQGIKQKSTTHLAKAISLMESHKTADKEAKKELLSACTKTNFQSKRLAITGVPGAGKSTFIETFGLHLTQLGQSVAVLAIDPSSSESQGALLGDKTRMTKLANEPLAFIRPTASGNALGGIAQSTYQSILLCEAAEFDWIIIETVGVGQAEFQVRNMVDLFLLLAIPVGGDELQAIKRGILEMVDIVAVNKSEPPLNHQAKLAKQQLEEGLHYIRTQNETSPQVHLVSAITGAGISNLIEHLNQLFQHLQLKHMLTAMRGKRMVSLFEEQFKLQLLQSLKSQTDFKTAYNVATEKVALQQETLFQAIETLSAAIKFTPTLEK